MKWTVENVPELRGYAVEWAEKDNYYLSRRNELFHSKDLKPPFKLVATIDAPFWRKAASKFRLAQRALRFMIANVVPLKNGDLFVTFDKSIGVVSNGKYRELGGTHRPFRVLRAGCATDKNGDIFFGEYIPNNDRGEMRIYKYTPGANAVEVAHTFPPNTIRHIHGIYLDKFTDSLVCLTGDKDDENCFWQSFDGFKTMKPIGIGDETWRAVSVLFNEKSLFYGMDAEYRTNHIYKLTRENTERKSLGEVGGTVFYSKKLGDDLFFTTTVENAPSQKENVAAIWHVDENDELRQLISFKKDRWHPDVFMFGVIHFPYENRLENELYFQPVSVEEDNRTFRIKQI